MRNRILDQAQRFLLTLAVHDSFRRARCAEEVSRHGLSLGSDRRRWLFDAATAAATISPSTPGQGNPRSRGGGGDDDGVDANETTSDRFPAVDGEEEEVLSLPREEAGQERWSGPSSEALEAGGDVLFAEIRAAAPSGYFGLRGKAGQRAGGSPAGEGEEREELEETLDWVFDRKEAGRVAAGKNMDLVLLEVVMTMLKEQVNDCL